MLLTEIGIIANLLVSVLGIGAVLIRVGRVLQRQDDQERRLLLLEEWKERIS